MKLYYVRDNERIGPLDELAFRQALDRGEIQGGTRVWKAGMPGWLPYGRVEESFLGKDENVPPELEAPVVEPSEDKGFSSETVMRLAAPIASSKGWIQFIGSFYIFVSAILILLHPSAQSIIQGAAMCIMGILMIGVSKRLALTMDTGKEAPFIEAMQKLRIYFLIQGFIIVFALLLSLLAMLTGQAGAPAA